MVDGFASSCSRENIRLVLIYPVHCLSTGPFALLPSFSPASCQITGRLILSSAAWQLGTSGIYPEALLSAGGLPAVMLLPYVFLHQQGEDLRFIRPGGGSPGPMTFHAARGRAEKFPRRNLVVTKSKC